MYMHVPGSLESRPTDLPTGRYSPAPQHTQSHTHTHRVGRISVCIFLFFPSLAHQSRSGITNSVTGAALTHTGHTHTHTHTQHNEASRNCPSFRTNAENNKD